MNVILCGMWTTAFILMMTPWDLIPICLPQILHESETSGTTRCLCILNSSIIRWSGTGTILGMLPTLSTTKRWVMACALIVAGLFGIGIIYIYMKNLGNCQKTFLPCRAIYFPVILSVGGLQLLLAVSGLKKLLIDKHLPNPAAY